MFKILIAKIAHRAYAICLRLIAIEFLPMHLTAGYLYNNEDTLHPDSMGHSNVM